MFIKTLSLESSLHVVVASTTSFRHFSHWFTLTTVEFLF